MRQIAAEKAEISTIESQLSIATTSTEPIGNVSTSVDRFYLEEPTETFDQYTEKVERKNKRRNVFFIRISVVFLSLRSVGKSVDQFEKYEERRIRRNNS